MVGSILHKSSSKLPFKALAYRIGAVPKRFVSTLAPQQLNEWVPTKLILNPWFITGFTDGDGCFTLSFTKDSKYGTGWRNVY